MSFNTDGFNERSIYIHNQNDMNKLRNSNNNFDNSFARMRADERRNMVKTTTNSNSYITEEIKGKKENFIVMNNNINNANVKVSPNNPVKDALNRNMFKR